MQDLSPSPFHSSARKDFQKHTRYRCRIKHVARDRRVPSAKSASDTRWTRVLPSVVAIRGRVGTRIESRRTPKHIRHWEISRDTNGHRTRNGKRRNVPANSIDRLVNAVVRGSSAAVVPLLLRSSIARCPANTMPPSPALIVAPGATVFHAVQLPLLSRHRRRLPD